jgi:hypothetical protein
MSDKNIEKIAGAILRTLAELENVDPTDVLNALTQILIDTVKAAECLTTHDAYLRIANVLFDAAKEEPLATKLQEFLARRKATQ